MPATRARVNRSTILALWVAGTLLAAAGCGPTTPVEEEHHHHHRGEGPHGGHLAVLGDSGYTAEWLHDDEKGLVTVILIDKDNQEVALPLAEVSIDVTAGGQTKRYALPAKDASSDDPPKASHFELQDAALAGALEGGEGLEARVVVALESGTVSAALEHHH